jgi:putative DNA primase/helicase
MKNERSKEHPDANDTLREQGVDALRARHDRARKYQGNQKRGLDHQKRLLPPPSEPMAVARIFVRDHYRHEDALTLRHWRGGWWAWETTHWVEIPDGVVRSVLYHFTELAAYVEGDEIVSWSPTRHKITNLTDALAAICVLDADIDQPTWLDTEGPEVVSVANGLLDIERRKLIPHTPKYFSQTTVPFDYDPQAPQATRWLRFLADLWPTEPTAIDVLAQWFGYVISGRTDLHKILLMVGPTRGGKGAIARVLTALVGRKNVAGPTLNSLSGEFGLAPLIGKPLAVISDARFAGRDASTMVERLLSISGEDTLTVNRKYRDQWTGKLPSRLHILSNELPKLGDASTAIVGRIVLLLLSHSWLGREDHSLEPDLRRELPAILNWSLHGLHRLNAADSFTRITSAEEAIIAMRDLASPVGAFVREKCKVAADSEIGVDHLYDVFKQWAEANGHSKKSKEVFGRDLRAAVPSISKKRPRDENDKRPRSYVGIGLADT